MKFYGSNFCDIRGKIFNTPRYERVMEKPIGENTGDSDHAPDTDRASKGHLERGGEGVKTSQGRRKKKILNGQDFGGEKSILWASGSEGGCLS